MPSHEASRRSALRCAPTLVVAGFALLGADTGRTQERPRAIEPSDGQVFADWSGPYGGVGGSGGNSFARARFPSLPLGVQPAPGFTSGFSRARDDTPWLAGGFAGWNWQAGRLVAGLEGTLAAAPFKRAVGSDAAPGFPGADPAFDLFRLKRELDASLRVRVGYAFDDYLLYATTGPVMGRWRAQSLLPDGAGLLAPASSRDLLGFTFGFGIDVAVAPQWALGIDYRRSIYPAERTILAPGFDLGRTALRGTHLTTDDVMARLTYYPDGIKPKPEAGTDPEGPADWSIHGQTTAIQQGTPSFRSPYLGPNSFVPRQARETWTATGYFGRRLWEGGELYVNPEVDQGFGLSRTLGIAGFVNGEAQKAGAPYPKYRTQRYFLRQTIGLGGETETVPDGLNQIAGSRDVDRVTIIVGKFAVGDFFDNNAYAHDPRIDFNNWAIWGSAAYDFPANLPGYTQGGLVELNRRDWAIRAGFFQVPKLPASDVLDPRIDRKNGAVVEFEGRYSLFDQAGKIRLGVFTNVGRTTSYREAATLAALDTGRDINDIAAATRRDRRKSGLYANLEQPITDTIGVFGRASWSDGRNEMLSFTDIDRSLSGGLSIKGASWSRPKDTLGIGAAVNALAPAHRDYFALGGLGLLIGDGRLNYRPERAFETFYSFNLIESVSLTVDYQFVVNPGFNADRGPVHVFGSRLHAEF